MRVLVAAALLGALAAGPAAAEDADGASLYLRHCAACHGLGARGDGPDANLFRPAPRDLRAPAFLEDREPEELVRAIADGARRPLALDPDALRDRLRDTESLVAHLEEIPDANWRLVERGQAVWTSRCETCHGPFGRPPVVDPGGPTPPDLSAPAFQRRARDADIVRTVREGHRDMRAVPTVRDDADARALVAFVRILSPGFELYSRHCATCHGDDGRPQREFVDARQRPAVVFDRPWLDRRDPAQLRAAVSHMLEARAPGMPHFRTTLDDAEVRAIVRHLRRDG